MRRLTFTIIIVVLAAFPSAAAAQGVDQTCQFSLTRLDATTANVLAVDTNAVYWVGGYTPQPGTRIRIDGHFPHSRYMGWNVYDAAGRPIDALADYRLRPREGSSNPFRAGANRFARPRGYTAFIEFRAKPRDPKPNTLYAGDSRGGTFWYRVYIPDEGRDAKGGVPLPRVTLERRDGSRVPLSAAACRALQAPYLNAVNDLIANAPGIADLTDDGKGYPGRNPPNWRLFVNFSQAAIDLLLNNETGDPFHDDAQDFQNDGPGFFSNRDISYVFTGTSRGFGEVLVVRGRAPTFANTRSGARTMPSGKQLRYWSFCQYEPATQRVIDCRSDDRVALDRDGHYTVVVSTPGNRPSNARARCGVTWLPWGPQTQGLLIYRHMLADRDFSQAIQRVPDPGKERKVMAGYYPAGKYFAGKEAFEARGCPTRR